MERTFPIHSKVALSLVDKKKKNLRGGTRKQQMEIFCKWNGNLSSVPVETRKLAGTTEGRPFVPENARLMLACQLPAF